LHVFDVDCAAGVDVAADDLEGNKVFELVQYTSRYIILRSVERVLDMCVKCTCLESVWIRV
jgi:hypothetical protein